jgi:hypothetical protein
MQYLVIKPHINPEARRLVTRFEVISMDAMRADEYVKAGLLQEIPDVKPIIGPTEIKRNGKRKKD